MATVDWKKATRQMLIVELRRRYEAGTLDDVLFGPPVELKRLMSELSREMALETDQRWS